MPNIAFINGRFMPLQDALVSVEDRGYQFADGVYEVIRTYRGTLFQESAHLQRLERSAAAIGLAMPFPGQRWHEHMVEGVRLAGFPESKVYLQITRGVAPRDHAFPASTPPTAVMTIREMHPLDSDLRTRGVGVMVMDDLRWGRCDIKSINLLPNVMARQQAREAGAFEVIFIRDGWVTEGAVSNVMLVRNGVVLTPKEGERILSGVTRTVILGLARKSGIPVEERDVSLEELRAAQEMFLTGTTVEVLPVVRCDGLPVGSGKPGDVTMRLYNLLHESLG
jgi:D-alanine transaminase